MIESYGRTHNDEPGIRCWCHLVHVPLEPVPREELASLNPGMDERGLARLAVLDQLIAEDDAASGYQDPDGPPDSCEGKGDSLSPEEYAAGMLLTCDDCGAGPGEACAWSCSSRWR